jgi:hypothetical protein
MHPGLALRPFVELKAQGERKSGWVNTLPTVRGGLLRRLRARALATAALTAVLSCGCPRLDRPVPIGSGAEILERLATDRARVGPLTATFDARLRRPGAWFTTGAVSGVLAMQPPDRFRVKLFLPGGLTVQDLTMVGDDYRLILPLEGQIRHGRICVGPSGKCEDAGPGLALAWIFTRDLTVGAATSTVAVQGDRYVVVTSLRPQNDLRARLAVSRAGFRLLKEEMFEGSDPWLRAEFDDYRPIANVGVDVPHRVRVADDRNGLRIDLDIRKYSFKRALPQEMFRVE